MTETAQTLDPNRFEALVDIDTDGAVFQVGLQHYKLGPPGPALRINTGAVEIVFQAHATDIDAMIDALTSARKKLAKARVV